MANNLPDNLKTNWVDNETVMPVNVNGWSSAINKIKDAVPVYSANGNFYTATYGSNIYSLSPITMNGETNVPPSAYIDGMKVVFKCPTNNSANCSVNVNSLGNKSIKNLDGSNIGAGVLVAGNYIELIYDNSQGYFKLLTAHYLPISSVAGKGSASLPVYFDANGKAQPITSYEGNSASATKANQDANGDVIDVTYAKNENLFDKMNQSKAMETGSVSYVEEVLQDVIKYKNGSFDASKFTKVGNPIITDDGIMTYTAHSQRVKTGIVLDGSKSWKIRLKYKNLKTSTGTSPAIIGLNGGANYSNQIKIDSITSSDYQICFVQSGTAFGYSYQLQHNKEYLLEFVYEPSSGYYIYVDGVLRGNSGRKTAYNCTNAITFGGVDYQQPNAQIDLKYVYIEQDGEEVFNGHQEGIDTLKPNDFTTVTTIYAYKFGDNTVYSNVTNNTNPTELYNADGSYYLGTAFDIINDKVTYPEQATRGTDDITIEGVTYYEFEHTTGGSSTNIYADDPTTPTALFNSDGSEYTGTQWNIMSSKVYYLNDATYTASDNITINRDYNTVDAGVKISDDGIVSGFSGRNYLKKGTFNITSNDYFRVEFPFLFKTLNSVNNFIFSIGGYDKISVIVYPGSNTLSGFCNGGFSGTIPLTANTRYKGIFEYKNGTATISIINIVTGVNVKTLSKTSIASFTYSDLELLIGTTPAQLGWFFGGSVDLNGFKVYVNGDLVYQPCLKIPYIQSDSKYGSKIVDEKYRNRVEDAYEQGFEQKYFTLQENKKPNYTVVGSPTISSDWIASGFSDSNYLITSTIERSNPFVHFIKIKTSNDVSSASGGIWIEDSNTTYRSRIQLNENGLLKLFLTSTGNGWDIAEISSTIGLVANTNYYIKFSWTGTQYLVDVSTDGIAYTNHISVDSSTALRNLPLYVGKQGSNGFTGSIDLKEFKIYGNNKLSYQAVTDPNFTLPLGELYGLIESKVPKTSLKEVICIVEDYTFTDANAFCWDLSNGWRIQGATQTVTSFGIQTIPLLKNFANNNYIAFKNYHAGVNTAMQDSEGSIFDKTTSSFKTSNASGDTTKFDWIAIGKIG